MPAQRTTPRQTVPPDLALAFAPLYKAAFGVAVGTACGLLVLLTTVVHLLRAPAHAANLALLAEYFYGYHVSWMGALIGAVWGFLVGFAGGWFVAFCRNLVIITAVFIGRTRAELSATRDFLDHI